MLRLATPWLLLALPAVVFAVWWMARRRATGDARVALPRSELRHSIDSGGWARLERTLPWLRGVILVLLVVFAAPHATVAAGWWGGVALGLSFGGGVDYLSLEPAIGYRVTDNLTFGTRLLYRRRRDERFNETITTKDYGASLFGRYFFAERVFTQIEYEVISW